MTAANASGINDSASAVVVIARGGALDLGLKPMAAGRSTPQPGSIRPSWGWVGARRRRRRSSWRD